MSSVRRFPDNIETRRLLLRKPQPSDAAIIFRKYAQDRDVARYMIWMPHRDIGETAQFIAGCRERWDLRTEFSYIITSKSFGGVIFGSEGLGNENLRNNTLRNISLSDNGLNDNSDDAVLGMVSARPSAHGIDIGYVLARAHWGQGLMPEAVSTLIQLALYTLDYFRVQATCDIDNRASARVMEKAGMIREGVLRRYIVHPNISAEPRDSYLYAATR